MDNETNKYKDVNITILISILVIIFAFILILMLTKRNANQIENTEDANNIVAVTDDQRIQKAESLFGNDYCEANGLHPATFDLVRYKCVVCGKDFEGSGSRKAEICDECADITNRCTICGKLLKQE